MPMMRRMRWYDGEPGSVVRTDRNYRRVTYGRHVLEVTVKNQILSGLAKNSEAAKLVRFSKEIIHH
jgi:hypothetical protein